MRVERSALPVYIHLLLEYIYEMFRIKVSVVVLLLFYISIITTTITTNNHQFCHGFYMMKTFTTKLLLLPHHVHDTHYCNAVGCSFRSKPGHQQQLALSPTNVSFRTESKRIPVPTTSTTASFAATSAVLSSSFECSTILVRSVYIRALAVIYTTSFAIALVQNKALIGDRGITPAKRILDEAQARGAFQRKMRLQWRNDDNSCMDRMTFQSSSATVNNKWQKYLPPVHHLRPLYWLSYWIDTNPTLLKLREVWWDRTDHADRPVTTLLWFANENRTNLNSWFDAISFTGLAFSLTMVAIGAANVPGILGVWMLHRSLMAVGGPWYAFGWEPQLAELGFHTLFLEIGRASCRERV